MVLVSLHSAMQTLRSVDCVRFTYRLEAVLSSTISIDRVKLRKTNKPTFTDDEDNV